MNQKTDNGNGGRKRLGTHVEMWQLLGAVVVAVGTGAGFLMAYSDRITRLEEQFHSMGDDIAEFKQRQAIAEQDRRELSGRILQLESLTRIQQESLTHHIREDEDTRRNKR